MFKVKDFTIILIIIILSFYSEAFSQNEKTITIKAFAKVHQDHNLGIGFGRELVVKVENISEPKITNIEKVYHSGRFGPRLHKLYIPGHLMSVPEIPLHLLEDWRKSFDWVETIEYLMNFGKISCGKCKGVIVLHPDNDRCAMGDIRCDGGSIRGMRLLISGEKDMIYSLVLPDSCLLMKEDSKDYIVAKYFTHEPQNLKLNADGKQDVRVGALLFVDANQPEGEYEGSFDVKLLYHSKRKIVQTE